ncbi:hypothetical protein Misp01_33180 [Microtetraspora sp. NBRC 13810]|uniref:LuxR family transcriptional regulator n=1 Tax=Microtetraspora sp. NBRC 13810 TaxID=3030990 RepID=UPI0024A01C50|nr:LuxR family transcriptional regulator [Microtetraspora sp. NBRC 13810]GLW08188.1 hypothetical protein Misp01_33180 [Microtetraspora sp. NBRC 13810]
MRSPLIGRDAELAALGSLLADPAPSFVLVTGEPGIGKTRLLAAFAALASGAGVPAMTGRGLQFQDSVPFGMWLDAATGGEQDTRLAEPSGRLLSVLSIEPAGGQIADGVERHRLHRQVRALLADAAEPGGLVLLFDDVHWADDASVEVLDFLARRPCTTPVVVVLACRTGRVPTVLERSFAAAADPPLRMALGPLAAADVDTWLSAEPSRWRRERLRRASGGNPLFLEILSDLPDTVAAEIADGPDGDALATTAPSPPTASEPSTHANGGPAVHADTGPNTHVNGGSGINANSGPNTHADSGPGIHADSGPSTHADGGSGIHTDGGPGVRAALGRLIFAQLGELDAGQRLIAQAAAVAGDGHDARLVAAVSEADAGMVERALDDLVGLDVLRPGDGGLAFRHPLVRAAAYRLAGPAWRAGAHRRAAAYLRSRGAPLVRCAAHMEHAVEVGDLDGAELLAAAGHATLATAPTTAARWLRAALAALPALPGLEAFRTGLRLALAKALGVSGRLAESRELLHEMLRSDGPHRSTVAELLATMNRSLGLLAEARAVIVAELAAGPASRAELLLELAVTDLLDGRWHEGEGHAVQALASTGGRPGLSAAAFTLRAVSRIHQCAFADGVRLLDRAALLTDALTDRELCEDLTLIAPLAWAEFLLDRHPAALGHLERGLRIARRHGRHNDVPLMYAVRTAVNVRTGKVADALADSADAEEMARHLGSLELLAFVRAVGARPLLWAAGPDPAMPSVEEALAGDGLRSAWWRIVVNHDVAEVLLSVDRGADCRELLASRVPADPAGLGPYAVSTYAMRSQIEVSHGDLRAAAEWYERAAGLAAHAPPAQYGCVARAAALIARAEGDHPAAAHRAREAVDVFRTVGLAVGEGFARMLLAEIESTLGDARGARRELGLARELFTGCGAPWLAGLVAREQRRTGARQIRRRPAAEPLSGREREIAELVAQGMTNRQIADRLYLSPRTVETHLARAYQRLGVHTRAALARLLSEGPR